MNSEFWGSDGTVMSDMLGGNNNNSAAGGGGAANTMSPAAPTMTSNANVRAGGGQSVMNPQPLPAGTLHPQQQHHQSYQPQQQQQQQQQQPAPQCAPHALYMTSQPYSHPASPLHSAAAAAAAAAASTAPQPPPPLLAHAHAQTQEMSAPMAQQQPPPPPAPRASLYQPAHPIYPTPPAQYTTMAPTSRDGIGMRARDLPDANVMQVDAGAVHQNPLEAGTPIMHRPSAAAAAPSMPTSIISDYAPHAGGSGGGGGGTYVPVGERVIENGDEVYSGGGGDATPAAMPHGHQQQQQHEQQSQQDRRPYDAAVSRPQTIADGDALALQQQPQRRRTPALSSFAGDDNDDVARDARPPSNSTGWGWVQVAIGAVALLLIGAIVATLVCQSRAKNAGSARSRSSGADDTAFATSSAAPQGTERIAPSSKSTRRSSKSQATRSASSGGDNNGSFFSASRIARELGDQARANDETSL